MTVHMVRVFSHFPNGVSLEQAQSVVQNWVDNQNQWADDTVDHEVTVTTTGDHGSGTEYLFGDFRFESTQTATEILDAAENALQGNVGWYRLGYHDCPHDDAGGCPGFDGDATRTYNENQIPNEVPTFA